MLRGAPPRGMRHFYENAGLEGRTPRGRWFLVRRTGLVELGPPAFSSAVVNWNRSWGTLMKICSVRALEVLIGRAELEKARQQADPGTHLS